MTRHATATTLVEEADYWRTPGRAASPDATPRPFKEWQHFIIFGQGWALALNLSVDGGAPARVISLLFFDGWRGHVARSRAPRSRPGRLDAEFDDAGMGWSAGRYTIWQRGAGVRLEATLVPGSVPSVTHDIRLGEEGALSWCLVPRLMASGWFEHGAGRVFFENCVSYHDHNWGHFVWGGDFSWEWGCAVSDLPEDKWSVIFARMGDRARHRTTATSLFLVRDGECFRYFRNAEVRFRGEGAVDPRPAGRAPAAAALVLPDHDRDVPRFTRIEAERGCDSISCEIEAGTRGQILVPAQGDAPRVARMNEVHTRARVTGRCGGYDVKLKGPGLLEVLRG
jgi:hypothetical protein